MFRGGFGAVWLTYAVVAVPTALLMMIEWLSPYSFALLFDSQMTPWGVFTSVFIPDDVLSKVIPNLIFLLVYTLIFIMTNEGCSQQERSVRSRVYAAIVVGSAASANLLWLLSTPLESFGSSVIVYGAAGVTIGFAFYNMFPAESSDRKARSRYYKGGGWIYGLSNEFVFIGSFLVLAVSPSVFLGSFGSVNGFSHGVALSVAFVTTAVFLAGRDFWARRSRKSCALLRLGFEEVRK